MDEVTSKHELKQIGLQYHEFADKNKKGPKDQEEFANFKNPSGRTVSKILKTGKYVVLWDVDVVRGTDRGNKILAYVKSAAENFGIVCFQDGSVRKLSKDEFDKALQKTKQ